MKGLLCRVRGCVDWATGDSVCGGLERTLGLFLACGLGRSCGWLRLVRRHVPTGNGCKGDEWATRRCRRASRIQEGARGGLVCVQSFDRDGYLRTELCPADTGNVPLRQLGVGIAERLEVAAVVRCPVGGIGPVEGNERWGGNVSGAHRSAQDVGYLRVLSSSILPAHQWNVCSVSALMPKSQFRSSLG